MEKLNVKHSIHQHKLSYNEWVKEYRVGSGYIEPTKYYQGNNPSMKPIGVAKYLYESEFEKFIRVSRIYLRKTFSLMKSVR